MPHAWHGNSATPMHSPEPPWRTRSGTCGLDRAARWTPIGSKSWRAPSLPSATTTRRCERACSRPSGLELGWQPDHRPAAGAVRPKPANCSIARRSGDTGPSPPRPGLHHHRSGQRRLNVWTPPTELLAIAERVGDPVVAEPRPELALQGGHGELADVGEAEACVARNRAARRRSRPARIDLGGPPPRGDTSCSAGDADAEEAVIIAKRLGDAIGNAAGSSGRRSLIPLGHRTGRGPRNSSRISRPWPSRHRESLHQGRTRPQSWPRWARQRPPPGPFDEIAGHRLRHPKNTVAWLACSEPNAPGSAARLGRKDPVPFLRSTLEPYSEQLVVPVPSPGGSLDQWPSTSACFVERSKTGKPAKPTSRAAAATHERIAAHTWLARTRVEWARMLLARGRPGDVERAARTSAPSPRHRPRRGLTKLERDATQLLAGL